MATAIGPRLTAHDRLKASFWSYVWAATAFSAIVHFLVISQLRIGNVADYSYETTELQQIEVLEEAIYEIPPPPERIARPAVPVLSTNVSLSTDITIGEVNFDDFARNAPPPPPPTEIVAVDHSDQPAFTPYEIQPRLLNGRVIQARLLENYPAAHKRAGIGGVTTLWIYIDEDGQVRNTKVVESSGFPELDEVAQQVMYDDAEFTPAYNRDLRVPVWIQMPVTFEAKMLKSAG